ncbi:MAG: hypothetical protein HY809_05830 [Nitrospirae bacterium]|nr:hypothetical protein [Nitrospirota bacterium]
MPEIKSRDEAPVPGIDYSEIHIPNDNDLGTGTFKTVLKEDIMGKINPIISSIANEPDFLMLLTINTAIEEINVMLGKTEKEPPLSRVIFRMPKAIENKSAHTVDAHFKEWKVTEVELNGQKLEAIE